MPEAPRQTYLPGTKLGPDEQLVPDNSVYLALHSLSYSWPCLSFDILRDSQGSDRTAFPHTAWIVTGTQAGDIPGQGRAKDEVVVMRLGSLTKTQNDDDDSDAEDDDDDDGEDGDATLDYLSIPHVGSVNRIRAAPSTSTAVPDPYYAATFSETGKVHVFDVKPYIDTLAGPSRPRQKVPIHTITNHGKNEGYALEWGNTGILTGDIASKIHLTTVSPSGFTTSPNPYTSHTSSVEDLQWSPNESTVFASCSADRTVRIWDIRAKGRKSVVSVEAHREDVNVISWNKGVDYLLLSGGDEGGLKVWDLRMFKGKSDSGGSGLTTQGRDTCCRLLMAFSTDHIRRMASIRYLCICCIRCRRSIDTVGSIRRSGRGRSADRSLTSRRQSPWTAVVRAPGPKGRKRAPLASSDPGNDHFHSERFF